MNFLYNANINNKIKNLSEIKEYDNIVDYINLFVYEENTKYNYYKIGDLVFVHHYLSGCGRAVPAPAHRRQQSAAHSPLALRWRQADAPCWGHPRQSKYETSVYPPWFYYSTAQR